MQKGDQYMLKQDDNFDSLLELVLHYYTMPLTECTTLAHPLFS